MTNENFEEGKRKHRKNVVNSFKWACVGTLGLAGFCGYSTFLSPKPPESFTQYCKAQYALEQFQEIKADSRRVSNISDYNVFDISYEDPIIQESLKNMRTSTSNEASKCIQRLESQIEDMEDNRDLMSYIEKTKQRKHLSVGGMAVSAILMLLGMVGVTKYSGREREYHDRIAHMNI